ncbi:hypothetical protein ACFY05_32210 [Microtetraspora fusca]|uniref:Uncharacterized protein n=1 Tax=Microtetraspora fusca TaxID=1997 RepID=A0ABW6VF45_MICFU
MSGGGKSGKVDLIYAVVITKPGHDTVRIGPIHFHHQAESWIWTLNRSRTSTAMPAGTTWEITPYDPSVPHDDPAEIPTTTDALAAAIMQTHDYGEKAFPDLFLRLEALVGTGEAQKRWKNACAYADHLETDEEEE